MSHPTAKRQGFTLIELLVVIAIISILAAILFPVFASAREKAKQATCQSNLKQIGLAFTQYLEDYDEMFPCDRSDPYLWQGRHFRWPIMPYLGFKQQRGTDPLNPYNATSPNALILTCPSDPATTFDNTSYAYSATFYLDPNQIPLVTNYLMLYPFGAFVMPTGAPPTAQPLARVAFPAGKVLVGEWTDNHDNIKPIQGWYPSAGTQDTWRNYLFVDCHVKYKPLSKMNVGYTGIPDPNTTVGGLSGADFPSS